MPGWHALGLRSPSLLCAGHQELGWTGECIFVTCTTWLGDCHLSEEANVVEVDWFADAGISDGLSVCLGCPVFKRDFQDDRTGNLWPVERLTPCKLASLPHSSHSDNLVVLSRFASFMHQVPEVS